MTEPGLDQALMESTYKCRVESRKIPVKVNKGLHHQGARILLVMQKL